MGITLLSGHSRYAHINGILGDGVNLGLLGLSGTVSEDCVLVTSLDPVAFPTMLMAGVGRQIQSGGQRTAKVSVLHKKATSSLKLSPRLAKSCMKSAPSRSDGTWSNVGPYS